MQKADALYLRAAVAQHRDNGLARCKQRQAVHKILDVSAPPHNTHRLGWGFSVGHPVTNAAVAIFQERAKLAGSSLQPWREIICSIDRLPTINMLFVTVCTSPAY